MSVTHRYNLCANGPPTAVPSAVFPRQCLRRYSSSPLASSLPPASLCDVPASVALWRRGSPSSAAAACQTPRRTFRVPRRRLGCPSNLRGLTATAALCSPRRILGVSRQKQLSASPRPIFGVSRQQQLSARFFFTRICVSLLNAESHLAIAVPHPST